MLVIRDLRRTSANAPSRWEGTLDDGRYIHIRYRGNRLTVRVFEEEPDGQEDFREPLEMYDFRDVQFDAVSHAKLDTVKTYLSERNVPVDFSAV